MSSKSTGAAKTPITSSHSHSSPTKHVYPSTPMRTPTTQDSPPPQKSNAAPSSKPNVMMSMTALLEQDDEDNILHYSIPKSKVLIPSSRSRSTSTPKNPTNISPRPRQRTSTKNNPNPMKRRSRLTWTRTWNLLLLHNHLPPPPQHPHPYPTPVPPIPSPSPSRPSSHSHAKHLGYTPSPLSRTPHSRSTSTAPDAFAELNVGIGTDGHLHLTKNGTQQSCMTCVEVVVTCGNSSTLATKGKGKGKGKALESPFSITNTREPPSYVPEGSVLVQVWAVGLDAVDARLCGVSVCEVEEEVIMKVGERDGKRSASDTKSLPSPRPGGLIRSLSLSRRKTKEEVPSTSPPPSPAKAGKLKQPELGYTPGRSFVGRIVEVGVVEDERDGVQKRGLGCWTSRGSQAKNQCGALQEFVVVDRRRIFRVPPPSLKSQPTPSSASASISSRKHGSTPGSPRSRVSSTTSLPVKRSDSRLTIDELALLPLCGVQAYRAVRTLRSEGASSNDNGKPKRILVLHGHDGVGAIAAQMLMKQGWKVVVHASCREDQDIIIGQVKAWGGDAVVFDGGEGVVKMMERWIEKGGFGVDAILDTVGAREREGGVAAGDGADECCDAVSTAASAGSTSAFEVVEFVVTEAWEYKEEEYEFEYEVVGVVKQFTTTVGDFPERPVPSASDHFKSGIRSMRKTGVDYTWVNLAQDIDFEGGDVRDALKRVIRMALEDGVRPAVGGIGGAGRVISLDKAPEVLVAGSERGMEDGNTIVVRVVE
ncbi:hypothetical protein AAF712_007002 [Marasmius tenuissimus]|uniref:Enoyl reductase (ER) domain-containing protein n=1 Tax=Marasmius tenuissimus TaxID=585030 RepID=A0ABR3A0C9_9AGAR